MNAEHSKIVAGYSGTSIRAGEYAISVYVFIDSYGRQKSEHFAKSCEFRRDKLNEFGFSAVGFSIQRGLTFAFERLEMERNAAFAFLEPSNLDKEQP